MLITSSLSEQVGLETFFPVRRRISEQRLGRSIISLWSKGATVCFFLLYVNLYICNIIFCLIIKKKLMVFQDFGEVCMKVNTGKFCKIMLVRMFFVNDFSCYSHICYIGLIKM